MARFIPDVNTKRWVVITPKRANRPEVAKNNQDPYSVEKVNGYNFHKNCPFCLGNEKMTPPEIYRWGVSNPNDRNWIVRVVPNKYQITDIHEVIIHSPDHLLDIAQFEPKNLEILLKVYRERYNSLSAKGTVIIFNNKGSASGESLVHPHSQVVVIPSQISLDELSLEPANNIVSDNGTVICFCPDFSQWPYETWIARKACCEKGHSSGCLFGQISDAELSSLALTLKNTLQKLEKKFPKLSYNYYIHPYGCFFLRVIPRLISRAGFELGTGLSVNIIDPVQAAKELRG